MFEMLMYVPNINLNVFVFLWSESCKVQNFLKQYLSTALYCTGNWTSSTYVLLKKCPVAFRRSTKTWCSKVLHFKYLSLYTTLCTFTSVFWFT